jgi:hypothetical protein
MIRRFLCFHPNVIEIDRYQSGKKVKEAFLINKRRRRELH